MHVHILGICGTFMGSLAIIAKQLGYHVSGSDENVYPPMSTQLEEMGIDLMEGFRPEHLYPEPDRRDNWQRAFPRESGCRARFERGNELHVRPPVAVTVCAS